MILPFFDSNFLAKYVSLKALGNTTVSKNPDGTVLVSYKQFDNNTGLQSNPITFSVNISDITTYKTSLQTQVTNLQTFLTDCQGAK